MHKFSKELTVQASGPHFSSQHPHEETDMVATLVIPTVKDAERQILEALELTCLAEWVSPKSHWETLSQKAR